MPRGRQQSGVLTRPIRTVGVHEQAPDRQNKAGLKIVDSRNFTVVTTTGCCAGHGQAGVRELHWHPNADEWQYYSRRADDGFDTGPKGHRRISALGDIAT